jgi:hypothetical protein
MTSGPEGQDFTIVARLDEIVSRYGEGHGVARFVQRARPIILEAAERVDAHLASC